MPSNRRFAFFCVVQLSICAPIFAAEPVGASSKLAPDTVVAQQGTATVTLADVDAFAQKIEDKQRAGFFNSPKRLESMISNLLLQRQLAAEAVKAGLDKDPSVQGQIRLADEDVLAKARMQRVRADIKLPDFNQLAREEYVGHKEKYVRQGSLDVKHILISTEKHNDAEAKALADQVRAEAAAHPDQFDALVEKYSEDPSKDQNHGLMRDARSKQYVPTFSQAAQSLKVPGEISQPVHTKYGYHVLKLVTRTSDTPLKFDEVKDTLVEQLRTEYINKSVKTHADELRNLPMNANADVVASLRDRYGTVLTPEEIEAAAATQGEAPQH